MGMNGVPSEKGTRLADTNRAMIQVIVFVSYWPLLAYDVHRLAFPAAFFKPAYFRDRKGGITRATASAVFFPGLVQVLSTR